MRLVVALSWIHRRGFAAKVRNVPIITTPKYLEPQIKRVKYKIKKEESELQEKLARQGDRNVCVISSKKMPELNHYLGQRYKEETTPSVAQRWKRTRWIGDELTFHAFDKSVYDEVMHGSEEGESTFQHLGLSEVVVDAIKGVSIKCPTEIQKLAIPEVLSGKNLQISSETGSGKTLAYLAPLMDKIRQLKAKIGENRRQSPYGLIVVPSRELAEQIGNVAREIGTMCGVGVAVAVGGLKKHERYTGFDLLVTTLGLLESHLDQKLYHLKDTRHLVLDEADTMLDDSFNFSLWDLLEMVKFKDTESYHGAQLILVSATIPAELDQLLEDVVDVKSLKRIRTNRLHHIMTHVKQTFLRANKDELASKILLLARENYVKKHPTIIFANRFNTCNYLYHHLNEHEIPCLRLNKSMPREERLDSFKRFQYGERDILVATDLGSRGLDTKRVTHIINFDCPKWVADYLHRAGRTGRCGSVQQCSVTTFIAYKTDVYMLMELERAVRNETKLSNVNANIKKLFKDQYEEKQSQKG